MELKRYYGLEIMKNEEVMKPNLGQINKIILNKAHNKFDGEVLELGWNSAIHVTKSDDRLQLMEAYSFQDNALYNADYLYNPDSKPIIGTHVVTRGISSCTFVYLHNGEDYWLFHLDQNVLDNIKLNEIVNRLNEMCRIDAIRKFNCLISHYNDKEENDFVAKFQRNSCIEARYEFNRGKLPNYLGHIEIGVYANSGNPILYGDYVDSKGDYTKFINYSTGSPMVGMLRSTIYVESSTGGCCPIL